MEITQVKQRVEDVKAMAGDPEAAHAAEDKLLSDVLGAIAAGAENPASLAFVALGVHEVSFPRWYA